jgi:hypothetical protein
VPFTTHPVFFLFAVAHSLPHAILTHGADAAKPKPKANP